MALFKPVARPTSGATRVQASTRLTQGGAPLPESARRALAPAFGCDFGAVRVHDDVISHAGAHELGAQAFALGAHLHFAAGAWRPWQRDGLRLLAHELAHSLQQPIAPSGALTPSQGHNASEDEADDAADAALAGRPVPHLHGMPEGQLPFKGEADFNPIPRPEELFRVYFRDMMNGEFDDIAARVVAAMQVHAQPSHYLQDLFEYAEDKFSDWEDNLAAAVVARLKDSQLETLAHTPAGRYALSQMYVAMITGSVSGFEREQANRVLYAKTRDYSPDEYTKLAKHQDNGRPTRVFPIRFMRITGGDYATPTAKLLPNGMVRVAYPRNIDYTTKFKKELRTIGNFIGGDGDLISANEIVIIKDYERDTETPLPALALVDYANQASRSTLGKIVEVSIIAATLGIGGGAVAAEAGEAATVRFTATAIWGARVARTARALDVAANVIGIAGLVINENRQWIISKLGKAGEWLVRISDIANAAVAIYGLGRIAQSGFKLAKDMHAAASRARSEARSLNNAQASVIDEVDNKLAQLAREIDEEAAKARPRTKSTAEPAAPHSPGAATRDAETIRASATAHGLSPRTLENEVADLRRQTREPGAVRRPGDKGIDAEVRTEVVRGDPHTYRRHKTDRTWCRRTEETCGLNLGNEANRDVDAALAKEPGRHPAKADEPQTAGTTVEVTPPKKTRDYRPPARLSEEVAAPQMLQTHFPARDWEHQPVFLQGNRVDRIKGRNPLLSTEPDWYSRSLNTAVEIKNKDFIARLQSVDWKAIDVQLTQRVHSLPGGTKNWIVFDVRKQPLGTIDQIGSKLSSKWDGIFFITDHGVSQWVPRRK